jgi:glucose/arabinose dehydrogenase
MQAHSAPLGITFYDRKPSEDDACDGTAFPEEMNGFAFIAFHGSWNRDPPTGYKVVYVAMDDNGDAVGEPVDLLAHEGRNANWEDGFRPVDVDFDDCGRLLLSSDGTSGNGKKIVRIDYRDLGMNSTCDRPSCQEDGRGLGGSPGKRYAAWMLIATLIPLFFI